jgi:hypothetical protein
MLPKPQLPLSPLKHPYLPPLLPSALLNLLAHHLNAADILVASSLLLDPVPPPLTLF